MSSNKFVLNTRTMSLMAMFAALEVVLEFFNQFLPSMPNGGTISFALIAIMLASYLMGPIYGLVVGVVSVALNFTIGGILWYGIASLILDYIVPMGVIGLSSLVVLKKSNGYYLPMGFVIAMVIKTISHCLSGGIVFATPLKANLIYNLPYNIGTLVVCFILFVLIYPRLKSAFGKSLD